MIFRNSEHYYDPTAGKAIENVMRETRGLSDRPLEPLRYDSLQTEPMQENLEDLAIAIIASQAEDYRAYRKQLRENPRMGDEKRLLIEVEILGIEMFFLSDWFCLLTKVDGAMILKRLKKEEDENDGQGISAAGLSA
jgi:hypothetical protein